MGRGYRENLLFRFNIWEDFVDKGVCLRKTTKELEVQAMWYLLGVLQVMEQGPERLWGGGGMGMFEMTEMGMHQKQRKDGH